MELCPLASVDGLPYHCYLLFTAVFCCLYLGIQKHSECLGLSPSLSELFWVRGYRAGLHTRFSSSSQRIRFRLQIPLAGSHQKCYFPSSSWFYFSGKLWTVKPLQYVLDVSEWASPFSAAECCTWENNLQRPGWGDMLMDKTVVITVRKRSFNYFTWVLGGFFVFFFF